MIDMSSYSEEFYRGLSYERTFILKTLRAYAQAEADKGDGRALRALERLIKNAGLEDGK